MIAVIKNSASWRAIDTPEELAENEVLFEGDPGESLVWGDDVKTLREPYLEELDAAKLAEKREQIAAIASVKIANLFGFKEKSVDLVIREVNLTARVAYLKDEAEKREISPEEQAEVVTIKGLFSKVMEIRAFAKNVAPTLADITKDWPA